jgi:Fe-S cluster biosynthesis and repair protein YggX
MKKAIFFILINCIVLIACKKENTKTCNNSQTDGKLFEYVEKDTASSFFNKKTFLIVESLNCQCRVCLMELRIRNLIDKEIEIKVFQDSTFNTLFKTETLSVTNWSKQSFYGPKSSIEAFTKFMKVSYK